MRNLSLLALLVAAPSVSAAEQAKADVRPNILFVIADDWGWPHAGVYGDAVVKVPIFELSPKSIELAKHLAKKRPPAAEPAGPVLAATHPDDDPVPPVAAVPAPDPASPVPPPVASLSLGPSILAFYEKGYAQVCDLVRQVLSMHGRKCEIFHPPIAHHGFSIEEL